ncbi:MAG TPA: hypothetical protein VKB73_08505 [Gaiellaceae bacterium]|nr:hypothetical protein [Gaiellaceae bacterium]
MLSRPALLIALAAIACASAPVASAALSDEQALATRYAPVVRLVSHTDCPPGRPYTPIDVNLLFGEPTVALRGPWGNDLVKIGPTASDLDRGLFEYHLDFPGNALDPRCDYLRWERRLTANRGPAVYAHIATDPGHLGKLALQYWLFYVFNDWNNLHEGDWEMIQLVFDAATAAQALERPPVEVGYSQHEGAERAAWNDDKLERVDGTHPVVHPAAGSHANFFGEALYLGSSAEQGVGCDDTRGPTFDVRPAVRTIPSAPAQARAAFPWIAFEGRWGELHPAFFNGPTGPNLKSQWTEPISWSEGWRDRSYTVPGGTVFGPGATGFFCTAIGTGSEALVRLVHHPLEFSLLLAGLVLVVLFLISRTAWQPAAPLRLARRRAWGQILSAAARMYESRIRLFVAIGILFVPISLLVTLLQALVLHATSVLGVQTGGENNGLVALIVVAIGTALTLLALGLVQAATARALVEIDEGRPIGPVGAYRLALDSVGPLFGALVIASVVVSLLASSIFLVPIAVWLAGRWALIAPAIELERLTALGGLRRSRRLSQGRWLKVATLIVAGAALVLVIGPLVGVLLILLTSAPFWLVNVIAGIIYAVAMPFVALTTAYVYFDSRVRLELAEERGPRVLPAEIELSA